MRWWQAALAALILTAASSQLWADECDEQQRAVEEGEKKNYRTVTGPDGRKVFVIEKAFVVCGKVPKPTVIYAIQASTINYEWESLKKDFIPLILDTVKEAPF